MAPFLQTERIVISTVIEEEFNAWELRLAHHCGPIWPDASRSVDPADARGGVGLLGDSERTKGNHEASTTCFIRTTPGFGHPADAEYDPCRNIFRLVYFLKSFMC
jgi:hypothetical protein